MLIVLILMLTDKSIADDAVDDSADAVGDRDEEFILMSSSLSSVNAERDDVDNDELVGRVIDGGIGGTVGAVIDGGRIGSPAFPTCAFLNLLALRLILLL